MSISTETVPGGPQDTKCKRRARDEEGRGASRAWGRGGGEEGMRITAVNAIVISVESIARRRDLLGKDFSVVTLRNVPPTLHWETVVGMTWKSVSDCHYTTGTYGGETCDSKSEYSRADRV